MLLRCFAGLLDGTPEGVEAAMKFFKDEFPAETPLALISSKNDHIATAADQRRLFVLATASRQVHYLPLNPATETV
jgi:hypothetical protein